MQKLNKFYPNKAYNHRKRIKYFVMFAVLATLMLMMDAWFIASEFYFGLLLNAILIAFIALIPKTLKENPVDDKPILELSPTQVKVGGKVIDKSNVLWVKAIVYLGSVGNPIENREFLIECASGKPLEGMLGSFEVAYQEGGKNKSEFAIFDNVCEALLQFVAEGKVEYRLGYSLGKEYRVSTYNLKEALVEKPPEGEKLSSKQKIKQLI